MTPFGHLTVSYITGRSIRNISLPAIIIGGVLPDLDFLFLFFDWFNEAHRVVTHNLIFIVTASLMTMSLTVKGNKQSAGLSLFLGGMLHLLIDSCMDNNPSNGIGIALLWPLSDKFFSPFNLYNVSLSAAAGWNEPARMIRTLVPKMLYEVPLYILSVIMFLKQKKERLK